jgi:3',5'-cyclic-nucleotide phosphodiesterase
MAVHVDLRVIGCHGGETPKHRTSAFVVDGSIAIDAGSLTSGLDLKDQAALKAVLVSHAHLDHIRDLATIADNRAQLEAEPLTIAATLPTISALKEHFFNNVLWPDFSRLPTVRHPSIRYLELRPEKPTNVAGFEVRAIPVDHTIDCCGFIVQSERGALGYSGDTGPTERLWQVLGATEHLKALLMEVSFPNDQARLARVAGHHTPETLARDLAKLAGARELPVLLYHIKPTFQARVERECARLRGLNLTVCAIGDRFML